MNNISSKSNDKIKDLIKLRDDSKFRNDKSLFYVEGERIIKDTPIEFIDSLYIEKSKADFFKNFLDKFDDCNIYILDDEVYNKVKDTVNSQGIIAIVKYVNVKTLVGINFNNINSCLILDNINDPGNIGTIIRMAEAAKIDLIIVSSESCSIYNTKVIRSCMSSLFRSRIYISNNLCDDIKTIKEKGFFIYSSVLNDKSEKFYSIKYNYKTAFVLGNEANGIKEDIIKLSDKCIYIPMAGNIESLNVAIAATVLSYELMRQNNYYGF